MPASKKVPMSAECLKCIERGPLLRVAAGCANIRFRNCRDHQGHVDAASQRTTWVLCQVRKRNSLMLQVYRMAGSLDRVLVLLQDRAFAGRHIERRTTRRG